jgi:hypothetical protein
MSSRENITSFMLKGVPLLPGKKTWRQEVREEKGDNARCAPQEPHRQGMSTNPPQEAGARVP